MLYKIDYLQTMLAGSHGVIKLKEISSDAKMTNFICKAEHVTDFFFFLCGMHH